MKVALVCTGLGSANRGFEIFFQTLFEKLKPRIDVTLYKGRGPVEPGVRTVWNLSRDSRVWSLFPKDRSGFFRRYKMEQMTSALPFLAELLLNPCHVVHTSEYHLARILIRLTRPWKRRPRFVLHNGHPLPASMLGPFDHIQQLTLPRYKQGLEEGFPEEKMSLLPIGIDPARYTTVGKEEARRRLNLPVDGFLILSVGAVNRWHKRMDWTIREIARVPGRPSLAIAGNREEETEELLDYGRKEMGERFRSFNLPHRDIPLLYRAADLFVLASLYEGFGMAFIEAMAAGLPVIAHNERTLSWLIGDGGVTVDMTKPGELGAAISSLVNDEERRAGLGQKGRERVEEHFSWEALLPRYLQMYRNLDAWPGSGRRR